MLQLSSSIRRGVWLCALGALAFSAGCGSYVGVGAGSEAASSSGGTGGAMAGSGGAGGAPDVAPGPWSKAFDNAYPTGVAVDPSGNIVVVGYFHDTVELDAGHKLMSSGLRDAFVVKFDPSGKVLWGRQFGGDGDQWVRSVAVDVGGNVFITGGFQYTINVGGGVFTAGDTTLGFLAKFGPSGNHLWSRSFGDGSGLDSFVAVVGAEEVVLTGGFKSSVDLGGGALQGAGGGPSVFLAKFGTAGVHQWSKAFGGGVEVSAIAGDTLGNAVITGQFYGPVDFGGGALPNAGLRNTYLSQFDSAGGHQYSHGFDVLHESKGTCVTVDKSGAFVLTGQFTGELDLGAGNLVGSPGNGDIFVARLTTQGTMWSKRFGDIAEDMPYGCAVSLTGDAIVTGGFGATTNDPKKLGGVINFGGDPLVNKGDADIFVAKLDFKGSHLFSKGAGDVDQQYGTAAAADNDGNTIVAGYFKGSIDLVGGGLKSPEGMFLAKFVP